MALRVFISYSHRDEALKDELLDHLSPLIRGGHVDVWHDRKIRASEKWREEIDKALASADVALLLVSASFLASDFCMDVEVPQILERHAQAGVRVVPVILLDCGWHFLPWLQQFQALPRDGRPICRFRPYARGFAQVLTGVHELIAEPAPPVPPRLSIVARAAPPSAPIVSIGKLPSTGPELFGREEELQVLDAAWDDPSTHLLAFIGFGGVGKSALVNHWLYRIRDEGFRGARRVFGWSFYSQGQRETAVSADQFMDAALRFFGDPRPEEGSPWDKGERLARLIREHRTLLILDGLEPLQASAPQEYGRIKDPSLETLLRELRYGLDGLCVISTRVEIPDPAFSATAGPARCTRLGSLPPAAGRAVLRSAGVKGLDRELDETVAEYEGHALALVLLGDYLGKFLGGDVSRRDEVPAFPDKTRSGRHTFRVIDAYDRALKRSGSEIERAILRVVALFDRPASKQLVDALRRRPAIAGVTDTLVGVSEHQWVEAVGMLRQRGLLSQPGGQDDGSLDAHPLVREWFGEKLAEESPEGFRQAHGRLYDHLRLTTVRLPETLDQMVPLYQAIHHGCRARRHQDALDDVLRERVEGPGDFAFLKLGAVNSSLDALSEFFEERWLRPVKDLREQSWAYVLNAAGVDLMALGRLREAEEALGAALSVDVGFAWWAAAATVAGNIVMVLLESGQVTRAHEVADRAVEYADRSGDPLGQALRRAQRAAVRHCQGRLGDALSDCRKSEQIHKRSQPGYPLLYSGQGAIYCSVLVDLGHGRSAYARAANSLAIALAATRHATLGLRDVGLAHVDLGRAAHAISADAHNSDRTTLLPAAGQHLRAGLDALRRSGRHDLIPVALLARASFHRDFGEREQAERDLEEALELSTRTGLRLHETDAKLLQGHMALDGGAPDLERAQAALDRVRQLIQATRYHLRDADSLILEGRLMGKRREKAEGRRLLEEAARVARQEEKDGCVYQVAVEQAERYLRELDTD